MLSLGDIIVDARIDFSSLESINNSFGCQVTFVVKFQFQNFNWTTSAFKLILRFVLQNSTSESNMFTMVKRPCIVH